MEEQFLSYTLSLKLKELGYNEKCFRLWIDNYEKGIHKMYNNHKRNSDTRKEDSCSAPLWQQAIEFLLGKLGKGYLVAFSDMDYRLLKWDNEEENFKEEGSTNSKEVLIEWLIEEVEKLVQISKTK